MTYDQLINAAMTKMQENRIGGSARFGRFGVGVIRTQTRTGAMKLGVRRRFAVDGKSVTKAEFAAAWQAEGGK